MSKSREYPYLRSLVCVTPVACHALHGLDLVVFESHKISKNGSTKFGIERLASFACFREIGTDTEADENGAEDFIVLLKGIRLLFATVVFDQFLRVNTLTELIPFEGIRVERNVLVNGAVVS